jgi:TP901 family phage tail tape measure protein
LGTKSFFARIKLKEVNKLDHDLGNLVVRIDLDGTHFDKGIATLNRQMRLVESEFKATGAILGNSGKQLDHYQLKADTLTKQLTLQQRKVEVLRESYEKSTQEKGKDARATQQLAIQLNRATGQLANMEHELKQVNATVTKQRSSWNQMSQRIGKIGDQMETTGRRLSTFGTHMTTHITAPVGIAGGAALRFAIHFEEVFAGVRKTVNATEKEFATFRHEILEMSKQIPVTAEEIAKVAESAGQLGIQKENILQFTRTMVDMSVATNLSSEEAATALARIANITQMPQQNFDRLASTIVALGNNLATTEAEITEMALRIAGAGHQVGLTEPQILSFAGALSSVGIQAEAGGSSISRVMIGMADAVQKGGGKLSQFAKVAGMSFGEFKKAFQQDASQAILAFIEGLGKMKSSGQNVFAVLQDLGLSEILVRDTLLRASGAGDLFRKSLELGSNAWQENTALTKEASERYKTSGSQLKILWNRIKAVSIELGDVLAPALLDLLDAAKPLIQSLGQLAKKFADLDPATQKVIFQAGLFAVALGPISSAMGGFTSAFAPLLKSFGSFSTQAFTVGRVLPLLANPIGAVVAGIGALAVAGVVLYKNWDTLQNKFPTLMKVLSVINPLVTLVSVIKRVEDIFSDAIPPVELFGDKVSEATQKAVGGYLKLDDQATKSLLRLQWSGETISAKTAETLIQTFDQMGKQIKEGMDKHFQVGYKTMQDFFTRSTALSTEEEAAILNHMNRSNDSRKNQIEEREKEIQAILQKASRERRGLTQQERVQIEHIQTSMRTQAVKNLSTTELESRAILEQMKAESGKLTALQAADVVKNSKTQRDQATKIANEQYQATIKEIVRQRDETGTITKEQADTLIKEAKRQRDGAVTHAQDTHQKVVAAAKKQAGEHAKAVDFETGEVLSKWGVFQKELARRWNLFLQTSQIFLKVFREVYQRCWNEFKSIVEAKVKAAHKAVADHLLAIKATILKRVGEAVLFLRSISLSHIGANLITGLLNGITSKTKSLYQKIKEIAHHLQSILKKALDIHSPSRVMMKIGQFTGEGLVRGIHNTIPNVSKQTHLMAQAAIPRMMDGMNRIPSQTNQVTTIPSRTSQMITAPSHYSITIPLHFHGTMPANRKEDLRALAKELAPEVTKAIQQAETHLNRAKGVIKLGY